MRIITGSTGSTHVTSDDDRQLNACIFGVGSYVLNLGNTFGYTLVDNNTITIKDGEIVMQGCHARINAGTTEDVTIETGTVGMYRMDLIVARYQLDTATGYESVNLVVVKGTEDASSYKMPDCYNQNDILRDGDTILDRILYYVKLDGINIVDVSAAFAAVDPISGRIGAVNEKVSELNSNLTELETKVDSKDKILVNESGTTNIAVTATTLTSFTATDDGTYCINAHISGSGNYLLYAELSVDDDTYIQEGHGDQAISWVLPLTAGKTVDFIIGSGNAQTSRKYHFLVMKL